MANIRDEFEMAYGQSLEHYIRDDTKGDYRKLLLRLIGVKNEVSTDEQVDLNQFDALLFGQADNKCRDAIIALQSRFFATNLMFFTANVSVTVTQTLTFYYDSFVVEVLTLSVSRLAQLVSAFGLH